jgi:hypothetical protein
MLIFKKNHSFKNAKAKGQKMLETSIKTICILFVPTPFSAAALLVWFFVFYKNHLYFNDGMEVIVTAAWIPVFGIMYSLLMAIVISTVWGEYKEIRKAVKDYNFETFMNLRDEEMSPLVHSLVLTFSSALLLSFMILKYPNFHCGAILVASTAYLLALIFFVIIEIDNPCSGFWFIKSIPEEWLTINPKIWRAKRSEEGKKRFNDILKESKKN